MARLSAREVEQRRHAGSTAHALQRLREYSYRGEFSISESDTEALAARLHVDKSIIVYNAKRFRAYVFFLTDLRGWWRRQVLDDERQPLAESPINSQQVALILELFLQMDGRCTSPIFDVRPSFSSLQSMFSTWKRVRSVELNHTRRIKVSSVKRTSPSLGTHSLPVNSHAVHVVNRVISSISQHSPNIVSSMATPRIWIVLPYVSLLLLEGDCIDLF